MNGSSFASICTYVDTKRCGRCKIDKPLDDFHRATKARDGRQGYCKQCVHVARDRRQPGELVEVNRVRDGRPQRYVRGPNHGMSKTPIYKLWKGMRERCHNPKAQNYRFYGGRGISVTPEWQQDFLAFHAWAMSAGYEPGLQLDRIDNERGYGPDNCRWVTRLHNLQNRRAYLPPDLEERLVAEAARRDQPVYALIRKAVEDFLGSDDARG